MQGRRSRKALIVLVVVIIVALLLILPPTQDLLRKVFLDPFSPQYPEEVEMELKRTLVLDANGGHVTRYSIDLPVPLSQFSDGVYQQRLTQLVISPGYDQLYDNDTYETMVWEGEDLYGQVTVDVTMKVTQSLHRWELDETTVLGREDVPLGLTERYLDDEWKIIVDDPIITDLREEIVGDEDNFYLIARSIYDWMIENVEYPNQIISGDPKSSLETYADLEGDCDDQSILFCALARSAGVPAWLQLGAIYDRTSGEMGGHGWVQMFMPTDDGGMNVTIDLVNKHFLVWMPNLFCEYTDDGRSDSLQEFYSVISVYYDPDSYDQGSLPEFSEGWEVISYEESAEKVTLTLELMVKVNF